MHAVAALLPLLALADVATALTGKFSQNLPFDGPNPTKVGFNLYEPAKVNKNAPLVVMAHPCAGSAVNAYKSWPDFLAYADKYGFPVIFPDSPWDGKCWDVSGSGTLKHNGGGDSQGIVSMVKYVTKKYNSDTSRIFVTGYSSGGMMTQVLVGSYPDVFAAGAEVSGVPFGCWADPNGAPGKWSNDCAQGKVTKTGAAWAKMVTDAYPGYSGYRPKLQLYHGTSDSVINYNDHLEAIKEWTSVFGISTTPVQTVANIPKQDWTKTVYGNGQLEAYSGKGQDHGGLALIPTDNIIKFFDLTCPAGGASCFHRGGASSAASTAPATTSPSSPARNVTARPRTTTVAPAPRITTVAPAPRTTTTAPAPGATTTAPGPAPGTVAPNPASGHPRRCIRNRRE